MRDPYEILGISPDAGEDEIKAAYRALTKKYQASEYKTSPLLDVAQKRLQEAEAAYHAILNQRKSGGQPVCAAEPSRPQPDAGDMGSGAYPQIRMAIENGELDKAERSLNGEQIRGAEWQFLMGRLSYKKGWLDQARQHFDQAAGMEPNNQEYQSAAAQMEDGGAAAYQSGKKKSNSSWSSGCDCGDGACCGLLCGDACCDGCDCG
ncbi:MAG: J domain-containing protein [Oscillospiraceae bacterium]|nr:J domain-containing protein [Oscillospiraceae bacterium]